MGLGVAVFELTEDRTFLRRGDIANQIQRAVLSISNNIAAGFERGTTQELITFLYKGQRYLNQKSRANYEQAKRTDAFIENLKKANEESEQKRKAAREISDLNSDISEPEE